MIKTQCKVLFKYPHIFRVLFKNLDCLICISKQFLKTLGVENMISAKHLIFDITKILLSAYLASLNDLEYHKSGKTFQQCLHNTTKDF